MEREDKSIEKLLPDNEILNKLLKELRYSGLAFAKELEYKSHSSIHHVLSGQNSISDDMIDKIIKKFPQVSYWFLKKGKLPIVLNDKLARNQTSIVVDSKIERNVSISYIKNIG